MRFLFDILVFRCFDVVKCFVVVVLLIVILGMVFMSCCGCVVCCVVVGVYGWIWFDGIVLIVVKCILVIFFRWFFVRIGLIGKRGVGVGVVVLIVVCVRVLD